MKPDFKMVIFVLIQLTLFYIVPLFMKMLGPIGMVFILLFATLINSALLGILSERNYKFLFPFITALIFMPSVFIFYNASALIHALWYFVVSSVGMLIGAGFRKLLH